MDDDVLDFMIVEALAVKNKEMHAKAEEEARRKEWRSGHREMGKA